MRWRSMLAAGVTATTLGALSVASPVSPATAAPAKPVTEADAVKRAAETGQPVEVTERNTETSQTLANPDGSFTLRTNTRPVRVKKDGAWRGIDTTLRANPDGTLAPVAAAADIKFSGGGQTPVVRVADGDAAVSVSWPKPLPQPVVTGNTATYPEVLPGVDLKLIADSDTYTQTLVVRDAEAARNPALANIKLNVDATNLTLKADEHGSVTAVDSADKVVFVQSTPLMWDSKVNEQVGPPPTAVFSGSGQVSEVKTAVTPKLAARSATSGIQLTLIPEPAALTGPDVKYPLYIDPVFSRNRSVWAEVTSNGWQSYNKAEPLRAGRCYNREGHCGGTWTARSFFTVNVQDLMPRNGLRPKIFSADVYVGQLHAANKCTAQPTNLHRAYGFDAGIKWGGPLADRLDTQSSAAGDTCPPSTAVRFNSFGYVQDAVNNSWSTLTYGLAAPDEGNDLQWKVFDNNPLLEAKFSFPPNAATGLRVSNAVTCTGKPITSDKLPTLYATATDNNSPPLNLTLTFTLKGVDPLLRVARVVTASGAEGRIDITTSPLSDGASRFTVSTETNRGNDQNMQAPASTSYEFTVRATPPAAAPVIEPSIDYPAGYWGAPNGAPGAIAVNANGASNIVGYTYTFAGSGTETVPKTTDCMYNKTSGANGGWIPHNTQGPNWIPIPAGLTPGYHTMHVRSFDDAHNLSPESAPYTFYVAPNTGLSSQRIEAESLPFTQPAGQSRLPVLNPRNDIGLSGGSRIFLPGNAAGQSFTMTFTAGAEADYDLGIGLVKNHDYGKVVFEMDGRRIGQQYDTTDPERPVDAYDANLHVSHLPLGVQHLTKGSHALTVKLVGTNAQSIGDRYTAAVDYLSLTQTRRYEAEDAAQVVPSQPPGQNVPVVLSNRANTGPAWSQGAALNFQAAAVGQSLDLTFQTPLEADYALGLGLTKRPDQGQLRIAVDGITLPTQWDGYGADASVYQPLGGAHLTAGQHRLTITVVGKNTAATDYQATVDYLTAVPINNVTATSFSAAMNNDGIGPDGTFAAFDLGDTGLSSQTMAAAGYAPGSTATIDGATFTMPAATAAGDNVIAIGQTIPVQQAKATAVGMLVTSTCGNSPAATATIRYTDDTTQDSQLPGIEDWAIGNTNLAAFVLPYRNNKTVVEAKYQPRIRTVFLPTDPTKTLKSVTLPNYGTNMLPNSCSPAMHVFAMAPRTVASGWLGTWTAPADMARPVSNGFANQTLRTVIKPSTTGANIRVKVGNPNTHAPVTIGAATVAAQTSTGGATLATPTKLTFGGNATVSLPAGGEALSDPLPYPVTSGGSGNLTVSLHLPNAIATAPVHAGSPEPTLLASGNATTDSSGTPFTTTLNGSYYVSAVDVSTADNRQGTVAVLGDQLSTGWVNNLPGKLAAGGVPVPGSLVNSSRNGISPTGQWKLNGNGQDSAGAANLTVNGNVVWGPDHGGSAALDGNTTLTAAGPVVASNAGHTVSAWVKITDKTVQTVVDQQNGFSLQTDGTKWVFGVGDKTVKSTADVQTGVWTHLVGIFDAPGRAITLCVNGVNQGTTIDVTTAATSGALTIGRGLKGSMSDVRAYQGIGTAVDASILAGGDPLHRPAPGLGASNATLADRTLDRTVMNQPGLRTVIVALGANDILAGADKTTVTRQLDELMNATSPTGIRNTRRTDGNLVRVVLTTIPALGLPDSDPREQRRKELNAELMANYLRYGADDVIDVATPVADPQHTNQLNPAYLTGGELNSAYHNAVAEAVSKAITKFPPDAQL